MRKSLMLVLAAAALLWWGRGAVGEGRARVETAYGVQMHIHSSLSEGSGSMVGHAYQARQSGLEGELLVDVLWYSDHAEMISHFNYDFLASEDFEAYASGQATPLSLRQEVGAASLCPGQGFVEERIWDVPFAASLESPRTGTTDCARAGLPASCTTPADPGVFLEIAGECGGSCDPVQFSHAAARYITGLEKNEKRALLSEIDLEFALYFPAALWSEDAAFDLRLRLTQDRTGTEQRFLHYWFGAMDPAALETRSDKYVWVEGPAPPPDQWNRYTVHVSEDARAKFPLPDETADDQVLRRYELQAVARDGASVAVYFDDLRIVTKGPIGDELYQLQADLVQGRYGDYFPDPQLEPLQVVGYEMNGTQPGTGHVNVFGTDLPLLEKCQTWDPTSAIFCAAGAPDVDWCQHPTSVVDWAHTYCDDPGERPCLVSYNHMFGTREGAYCSEGPSPDVELDEDVQRVGDALAYHADLIEIGYAQRVEPIESFLYVWDRLFTAHANHVVVTGTGVTDTHVNAWNAKTNRMISWGLVEGPEPVKPVDLDFEDRLLVALGSGRTFFGEMDAFVPGTGERIDLELQARIGGSPTCVGEMGAVVELPCLARSVRTRLLADVVGLQAPAPGRELKLRLVHQSAVGERFECQTWSADTELYAFFPNVRLDAHGVLRIEVWDVAEGDASCAEAPSCAAWSPVAFSNPIWLACPGTYTDLYGHAPGCGTAAAADAAWTRW